MSVQSESDRRLREVRRPAARFTVTRLRRAVLWAVPMLLLAGLAWSLVPWGGGPSGTAPQSPASAPPAHPDQPRTSQAAPAPASGAPGRSAAGPGAAQGEIRAGHLVETDASGHRRWQITADDVALRDGGQVVQLRNVHAVFYDPDGTAMTVTGNTGAYDTRTKDVEMVGDVHGVSATGRQLYADRLNYTPGTDRVTGIGNIRVVEERVIMYADRMISDTRLGETQFFGHVHMTVR
jgi:LPS export ABC transporter protein LptC